jgi:hypothetical protein
MDSLAAAILTKPSLSDSRKWEFKLSSLGVASELGWDPRAGNFWKFVIRRLNDRNQVEDVFGSARIRDGVYWAAFDSAECGTMKLLFVLLLSSVCVFGQAVPSPVSHGNIEILSDTRGVDFGPYLQDLLKERPAELVPPDSRIC